MDKLNVIHHMNEFRNIITYAANIGFFFGAGVSCAFDLPSIRQLTDEVNALLSADQQKLYVTIETAIKDLTRKAEVTIEDVLNHLREVRNLTKDRPDYDFKGVTGKEAAELDHEICNTVFKIIREDTEHADVSDLRRFFAWYDALTRGFIKEIYTTNYDMLFEMAMEANKIPYFDGFSGSYEPFFLPESIESFPEVTDSTNKWIRLWKLHGSLNWMKKPTAQLSTSHIIRVGKIDEPKNELMIYPSREKYSLSRKEPYIAYFDRLKKYLSYSEVVFIMAGYSFSDEHINEIIINALRSNSRLYVAVLCHDDQQVENMEVFAKSCTNLWISGPKKVIINSVKKEWIYDDSGIKDNGVGLYWDKTNNRFLLGDFKKLIDFLIDNSGRRSVIEDIINAK